MIRNRRQTDHTKPITTIVGLTMITFGISQIARPNTWEQYLPDKAKALLPVSSDAVLRLHGSGNIFLGVLFASRKLPKLSSKLATIWWLTVTPLCAREGWRTGLRDLSILAAVVSVARAKK